MTSDLIYDQLIGAGCASKVIFSWGGNPGVGSLHRLRDAVANGWPRKIEILEHSHAAVPSVRPDVSIVHAQKADRQGNVLVQDIIGDYVSPKVRLPGGGGAPEIATNASEVFVTLKDSKRTFVKDVDFVTTLGFGPVPATHKLLTRLGLSMDDIDIIELNEAFASQALACMRELGIADDDPRVNVNGGGIALGHPLGMTGARLLLTAAHELHKQQKQYALCTMCIGVGQGIATVIERV
ncbi:acetyl-CoA acetyltransferase [Marinobacter sp. ELB17]|nr:acetyl-CoA acetyltransferase [Marinobacter sp. ELB17]